MNKNSLPIILCTSIFKLPNLNQFWKKKTNLGPTHTECGPKKKETAPTFKRNLQQEIRAKNPYSQDKLPKIKKDCSFLNSTTNSNQRPKPQKIN